MRDSQIRALSTTSAGDPARGSAANGEGLRAESRAGSEDLLRDFEKDPALGAFMEGRLAPEWWH